MGTRTLKVSVIYRIYWASKLLDLLDPAGKPAEPTVLDLASLRSP